jgi:hypothetical protein
MKPMPTMPMRIMMDHLLKARIEATDETRIENGPGSKKTESHPVFNPCLIRG